MSEILIQSLRDLPTVTSITADTIDSYLEDGDARTSVLFFTGDPEKKKETADVAVVLRELLDVYDGQLRAGLVEREAEKDLMGRAGVLMLPSLAFFAGPRHIETIAKIQDWSVYAEKLPAILKQAA